jgi:hypothetical protein
MHEELCRDVAFEAAHRSTAVNPHELWAVLEDVNALSPRLIVDIWSDPAVLWAWWSLGARVVAVRSAAARFGTTAAPSSVTEIVGDPKDAGIRQRVADQCAATAPDVVVLGGAGGEQGVRIDWQSYAPMVRPGGVVLVHGIANRRCPGVGKFWRALDACGSREYVGGMSPDGYGLVQVHGRDRLSHG